MRFNPGPRSGIPGSKPKTKTQGRVSLTRLNRSHIVIMPKTKTPKGPDPGHVKLTTTIIGAETPRWPISEQSVRRNETKPPAYPFVRITCQRAASALETSQEAIGGGTHARAPPPVSAVYMEILPGAQAPFTGVSTISACGELAASRAPPARSCHIRNGRAGAAAGRDRLIRRRRCERLSP